MPAVVRLSEAAPVLALLLQYRCLRVVLEVGVPEFLALVALPAAPAALLLSAVQS